MSGRPILFVDDSAVARALVTRLLAERGLSITTLSSSEEAAAIDATSFGAALLDLELGDGFGTDVAERLRTSAPDLPVAFFSAGAPTAVLDVAQRFGPVFSKATGVDDAIRWVTEAAGRVRR